MDFTYLEAVMAGLAFIVIGPLADRLTGHMFRARQARSTERPRRQSQRLYSRRESRPGCRIPLILSRASCLSCP